MGSPRVVAFGKLQIEYVKSRKVLRFSAQGEQSSLELTPERLCHELAVSVDDLVPSRSFLLFGGGDRSPYGGSRDLVGSFPTEDEGRLAFARARRDQVFGWAELVAVGPSGAVTALAWFGMSNAAGPGPARSALCRLPGGLRRLGAATPRRRFSA